jgi:hypothetical protein
MAETNGQQDNLSRLDRIEIAIEHLINEHEKFHDDHKFLLRAQVVLTDKLDTLAIKAAETEGKLNALISVVDQNSREFHDRLKRLEEKQ